MPSNPAKPRGYKARRTTTKEANYFETLLKIPGVKVREVTSEEQKEMNEKVFSAIQGWEKYKLPDGEMAVTKTNLKYGFKLLRTASEKLVQSNFSIETSYFKRMINLLIEVQNEKAVSAQVSRPSKSEKWNNAIKNGQLSLEVWHQLRHNTCFDPDDMLTVGRLSKDLSAAKRGKQLSKNARITIQALSMLEPRLESSGYRINRLDRLIVALSYVWTDFTYKSLLPDNRSGKWAFYTWLSKLFEHSNERYFLLYKTEIEDIIRDEKKFLEK